MGAQSGAVLSLRVPSIVNTVATAALVPASDLAGLAYAPNQRGRFAGVLAGVGVDAAAAALMLAHARGCAWELSS
jgi:hypothetical protein